jgi:hypothetical protein
MAIAAKSLTSLGPQSAADPAAVAVATVSERSIIATTIIASPAIAIACSDDDGRLCNGHNIDNCLQDRHDNVIVENIEGIGTTIEQVAIHLWI